MNRKELWWLLFSLAIVLLAAAPVLADDGGAVSFGRDLVVRAGERVRGDAVVFGANAIVEPGGLIAGDLAVFGGRATIGGEVLGSVASFGGVVELQSSGVIHGDLVCVGSGVRQDAGGRVMGQTFSGPRFDFFGPRFWRGPAGPMSFPGPGADAWPFGWWEARLGGLWGFVRSVLGAIISALLLAGLAALATVVAPRQTHQVMQTTESAWPTGLGIGLLAAIVVACVALVLIVTLCLAPLGLLLLAAGAVAWFFGWVAVGAVVGERLFQNATMETTPALTAAVGTGLVTLLTQTPCIGWLLGLAVGLVGLGAVLLTHFGTQPYLPTPAAPAPVAEE